MRLQGQRPAAHPEEAVSRHSTGPSSCPTFDTTSPDDEWVNAIKQGTKSKGSFEEVGALAEAVTLAGIALRVPYKRLLWDAGQARSPTPTRPTR